jgi:hypothetical protein
MAMPTTRVRSAIKLHARQVRVCVCVCECECEQARRQQQPRAHETRALTKSNLNPLSCLTFLTKQSGSTHATVIAMETILTPSCRARTSQSIVRSSDDAHARARAQARERESESGRYAEEVQVLDFRGQERINVLRYEDRVTDTESRLREDLTHALHGARERSAHSARARARGKERERERE